MPFYGYCTNDEKKNHGVCPCKDITECKSPHLVLVISKTYAWFRRRVADYGMKDERDLESGIIKKYDSSVTYKYFGTSVYDMDLAISLLKTDYADKRYIRLILPA